MISLRNRLQQLSGSKPVLFNTLRYGTLGVLLLSGALLAQRPDSWEKERANAEAPTTKRSAEPAGNLGKPLDEVWRIVFHNSKGKDIVLDCEVARTEKEKERGLMFRKFLGKNRGMIFVYNQPDQMNFWMQNTLIPLDMIFIAADGTVRTIHENARPMDTTAIPSEVPVRFVLEIAGGRSAEIGLKVGDKFENARVGAAKP